MDRSCFSCGEISSGKYCTNCGQSLAFKRITLKGILHEAFHFFTHFDKGFPYTLKRLFTAPGKMQREYVEGNRNRYQKPFSMFFLCASMAALGLYWINHSIVLYFNAGNGGEAAFFHQYWVLLQVCLLPLYTLLTYLFFKNTNYNYAEVGVLQLYTFAFIFFVLTMIHLLKFIWPELQTRYIELPVVIGYGVITNMRFFHKIPKWSSVIKSVLLIALTFLIASYTQDLLVSFLSKQ